MRSLSPFLRDAWALARPYWNSEERWRARALLGVVILLNLALVGMGVLLTYWQRAFYNALEAKDFNAFTQLILWGHGDEDGFMPGFTLVAAIYILVGVYALYLQQALQIRWRRWLTERFLTGWLQGRAYYRISLTDQGTDNPDQRIADDMRLFVDDTLSLGLGLMNAVVTLLSFVFVLWGLSGPMEVLGVSIPGYMVWVALVYSVVGTFLAHRIGRKLIGLNFLQQRVEADFRYALVRFRENMEGVALHGGEAQEQRTLLARFGAVIQNWWGIMRATKQLTFFTSGYGQLAVIFPIVVAAPAYFAGRMPLGGLIQTSSAFGEVQGAMSWIVSNYARLTEWRATVERLTGFQRALSAAQSAATEGLSRHPSRDGALRAEGLRLALPDGRVLADDTGLAVQPGEAVLVTGASGSGKSTLFRALSGIWPFARGQLAMPPGEALFLPQRPYLPLGTLRDAIAYPHAAAEFPEAQILAALEQAGLGALAPRLDDSEAWDRRLSGGEQQRLALARALLLKPRWLFLDEATAALDPEAEEQLYATLRRELPETGILSIAHRPAVARHHDRVLRLRGGALLPAEPPGEA
ncbi:ABC transporter ATP-binding protein/permease [Pseudoroseomonas cervicalis]|uniref:ABC transporter, ATP-binding protein n=1 Tax=Pseudoroseomonas cervicalis ATCC 49957 TaxID=525371 RepID=D5RJA2_9PROT|nr:ABC transporter ATP-binding protein/permease [Pseudoroseomonas cervicalis]EFH12623.1 ABC transporter, ATP-binding protein [Pseudoroseomonas cervicalis ATCC 49957]